jgi:hypothetical protein
MALIDRQVVRAVVALGDVPNCHRLMLISQEVVLEVNVESVAIWSALELYVVTRERPSRILISGWMVVPSPGDVQVIAESVRVRLLVLQCPSSFWILRMDTRQRQQLLQQLNLSKDVEVRWHAL